LAYWAGNVGKMRFRVKKRRISGFALAFKSVVAPKGG
jgi:hypothetical protein